MTSIPPWAAGPFELILHGEEHLLNGDDFGRRMALISYDNAIEVSITTYLSLNPIQRSNRQYTKTDCDKWLQNYHTKLDFIESELQTRGQNWQVERSYIIWAHDHRNEQYHGGKKGTPERNVLDIIRNASLWIFGLLFDVTDPEKLLEQEIEKRTSLKPKRDRAIDIALDDEYGVIKFGEVGYYASELLFCVDYTAYNTIGLGLIQKEGDTND